MGIQARSSQNNPLHASKVFKMKADDIRGSLTKVAIEEGCWMSEMPPRRQEQWNHHFHELIQIETWDWWKAMIFHLRENGEYAEAEALFYEFKICD